MSRTPTDARRLHSHHTGRWACRARRQGLGAHELFVRQPLQIQIELDLQRMLGRKARAPQLRAGRDTPRANSTSPTQSRSVARKCWSSASKRACSLQQRTAAQRRSCETRRHASVSPTRCRVAKIAEQQLENFELRIRDALVVDQRRCTQLAQTIREMPGSSTPRARRRAGLIFRHRGNRDVQNIEEMPVRCAVRARPLRIRRRQCMQRVQSDETRAAGRQPADERFRSLKSPMPQFCRERTVYSCTAMPHRRRPSRIACGS